MPPLQSRKLPRRRIPFLVLVMFWLVGIVHSEATDLRISEFLADNKTGLLDDDGAASDWIELHNTGAANLNTSGYHLTDDPLLLNKWALPSRIIPAGGFLVIFASGKNRAPLATPWHTNFSLKASGEYLALTLGGQVVQAFSPNFPQQLPDVSYGHEPPQFMRNPTPGTANDLTPPGPLPVVIQPASGTFSTQTSISLTTAALGNQIRYTTDGSLPVADSPLFTTPISITSTTRLRARAFEAGAGGTVNSAIYVKLGPDLTGYTSPLPIIVLENFNAGGIPIKPLAASDGSGTQQVAQQSAAWVIQDRVANTASFSSAAQLAGEIGIRGRGYFSSQWTQKPYSIEPRNAQGDSISAGPLGLPSNNDWILYYPDPGLFKDSTMLYNAFSYQLSRNVGHDAARFRFVEVFLNTNGGDLQLADRKGVYLLMEKISRGRERLDFSPLSADGQSGGCLLSINRMDALPEAGSPAANGSTIPQFFHTAGPNRLLQTLPNVATVVGDDLPTGSKAFFNFEQPGGYSITPTQRAAVELWFKNFEDILYDDTKWRDPLLGYRNYINVKDFLGCYLLHNFVRHTDAMNFSLYPWLDDKRKLHLGPIWDTNTGGYTDQGTPEASLFYHIGSLWFGRLFSDPDFLQDYIDLWSKWRRTEMTDLAMAGIIDSQASEITPAKAVAQGVSSAGVWATNLNSMKTWVQGRAAYFDTNFAPLPVANPVSGNVASGTSVTLSAAGNPIWHTSDRSDPRQPGGTISPAANDVTTITISTDTRLIARTKTTGTYPWSAPANLTYAVDAIPASATSLRISEIHHHPADPTTQEIADGFLDADEFEFLELVNISSQKISLLDVRAVRTETTGITFDFSAGDQWTLQPGARLVIVKNAAAFAKRYGPSIAICGTYDGNLANSGDTITLKTSAGVPLLEVAYSDAAPWPSGADGNGFSLTWRGGSQQSAFQWRTSIAEGGTPGNHDGVAYAGTTTADWIIYALGASPQTSLNDHQYHFIPPQGADEADYSLEESNNLQDWTTSSWTAREIHVPGSPASITWTTSSAISPPLFLRLRAERRIP